MGGGDGSGLASRISRPLKDVSCAAGRVQEADAEGLWPNEREAFLAIGRQLKRAGNVPCVRGYATIGGDDEACDEPDAETW